MSKNPFESLAAVSKQTKKIRIVDIDSVQEVKEFWSEEQLRQKMEDRGAPAKGTKLGVAGDAGGAEIEIRRLTASEQKECEDIVAAVIPPQKTRQVKDKPSDPPRTVADGWDEDDPTFIKNREEAKAKQTALVVLRGVVGLDESTTGDDVKAKVQKIRDTFAQRLLINIASAIWGWSYSMGEPSDFFTIANSASATPRRGSSRKKD